MCMAACRLAWSKLVAAGLQQQKGNSTTFVLTHNMLLCHVERPLVLRFYVVVVDFGICWAVCLCICNWYLQHLFGARMRL